MNYKQHIGKTYTLFSPRSREWLPFSSNDLTVKVELIGDCGSFIVVKVLPHQNPKGMCSSIPYNVTLDKVDIDNGNVMFREAE